MSGYFENRMSNRALAAYSMGIKPRGKWTKGDIIERLAEELPTTKPTGITLDEVKKLPLWLLKEYFLAYSEWHHVGCLYKKVDFYDIDLNGLDRTMEFYQKVIEKNKAAEKEPLEYSFGYIKVNKWGTNKWGKKRIIGYYTLTGIVVNDWLYYGNGSRKQVYGRNVIDYEQAESYRELVKKVPSIKGTKKYFNKLIKLVIEKSKK